jgi:hypothetical protein
LQGEETYPRGKLEYEFFYFPLEAENVEVVLFDFDPVTGESTIMNKYIEEGLKVLDLEQLQNQQGLEGIKVKFTDFNHPNVYLMARKKDPSMSAFKFKLKFSWEEDRPLSRGVRGFLWFLFTLTLLGTIGSVTF